ncbi:MAG TPA: tripartite tricarboxylate transporter substrate binding protein [Burkholderiales bacterium]
MKKIFALFATLAFAACAAAQAAEFPTRPVRLLVGFPPGGPIDIQARLIAQKLSERLKQSVVVENRPGADGVLATNAVASAEPDGHTLILVSIGFATVPSLNKALPYDPRKDFAPVVYTAAGAMVLAAHPSVPAKNVKELLELARSRPGQINYGSAGLASSNHLGMELLARSAGVRMNHVPYKGAAPATTDLLAGRIQVMLNPISNALPHMATGKLRALGVSTAKRAAAAPDVPAIAETVPGFDVTLWSGILAPARTPPGTVALLNREIDAILASEETRQSLAKYGFEPVGGKPEDFARFVNEELDKWAAVVRDAGIKHE